MSDTVTPVAPATATAPAVPPHLDGLMPIVHTIPPAPVLTHPDFTPIKGPANPSQGPSTGDSTENGDNWHTAVHKINAMFKALFGESPNHPATTVETVSQTAIKDLEDQIAALQKKHDDLVSAHAATAATVAEMHTPQAGVNAILSPAPVGIVTQTS